MLQTLLPLSLLPKVRMRDNKKQQIKQTTKINSTGKKVKKTTKKKFRCLHEGCGKELCSFSALQWHNYQHTDKWPFRCDVCNKGSPTRYHWGLHKRQHDAEKMFRCYFCNKGFRQVKAWTKHRETCDLNPENKTNGSTNKSPINQEESN
jgi:uncharacterized C2H2 Zn-finger protein